MRRSNQGPARSRLACSFLLGVASTALPAAEPLYGLYPARDFQHVRTPCSHCKLSPPEQWLFENEQVAAPRKDGLPPLVWTASSEVLEHVRMASDERLLLAGGMARPWALADKLPTNLSYANEATLAFFAQRSLRVQGDPVLHPNGLRHFVARTIWPEDYVLQPSPAQPLRPGETLMDLVRAQGGGARSSYTTRVLWQRSPAQDWENKTILGLMLNGAQGDDDEAHGGHFATITGRTTDGSIHHWMVNNFYGIDSASEKGILAGPTPLDRYLMDLNNGQSYYRPSYMLVAVLKQDRTAQAYQRDMNATFARFYRHEFEYEHAHNNCAGISSDGFRRLGWRIPAEGNPDSHKAIPAYFYVAATEGSLAKGRKLYDYLTTEATRLYPAAAFDAMGRDLIALAQGTSGRKPSAYEAQLAEDLEALVFVRIPQVPSSRAWGLAPVRSFSEYMRQAPQDRATWKIVPAAARPMPAQLRAQPAADEAPFPVPAAAGFSAGALLALPPLGMTLVRRRRRAKAAARASERSDPLDSTAA